MDANCFERAESIVFTSIPVMIKQVRFQDIVRSMTSWPVRSAVTWEFRSCKQRTKSPWSRSEFGPNETASVDIPFGNGWQASSTDKSGMTTGNLSLRYGWDRLLFVRPIDVDKFTASAKRLGERLLTTPANQIHYIFSWENF